MAGIDAAEEFVAIAGIVATAPADTAGIAPESATDELDPEFKDHGLTTAAGVTRTEPTTSTPRYAWQNNQKLRLLVTQAAVRIQTILVQSSIDNIELFNGIEMVDGKILVNPGREYPHLQVVVDLTDGDRNHREYFPDMQIVEKGDQVAVAGDTYGWPVTLEANYDADLTDGENTGGYSLQFFSEFEGS